MQHIATFIAMAVCLLTAPMALFCLFMYMRESPGWRRALAAPVRRSQIPHRRLPRSRTVTDTGSAPTNGAKRATAESMYSCARSVYQAATAVRAMAPATPPTSEPKPLSR